MTKKLYWVSDTTESEVEVLQCEALADGRYAVRLNATPFHPQGGGQLADLGSIGDAEVSAVDIVGGEIVHYTQQMLALGSTIATVDAARGSNTPGCIRPVISLVMCWRCLPGNQ